MERIPVKVVLLLLFAYRGFYWEAGHGTSQIPSLSEMRGASPGPMCAAITRGRIDMKVLKQSVLTAALCSMLAIPAMSRAENPLDQIALKLLGEKFGIDSKQATGFLGRSNVNVYDAAPLYSTSHHTHHPVEEVQDLRQQGLGWGQIAQRLGMHPGTFNKLRKSGAFDRDAIWGSIYKERYGVRESDLAAIRRRGGSMRDALPACIIARGSRTSPATVYTRYKRDGDWERTASSYKVDLRNHSKYARKSASPKRITPVSVGTGKGHEKIKARAHRSDHGKPSDSGKGLGKSHGKGHGAVRATVSGKAKAHDKGVGKGHGHSDPKGHGKGGR